MPSSHTLILQNKGITSQKPKLIPESAEETELGPKPEGKEELEPDVESACSLTVTVSPSELEPPLESAGNAVRAVEPSERDPIPRCPLSVSVIAVTHLNTRGQWCLSRRYEPYRPWNESWAEERR